MAPTTSYRFDRTILKIITTEKKGREAASDPTKIPQLPNASPESNLQEALEKNISISKSGRTLKEILSLSCQNLKSYTIDRVRPGVWGQSTNVKYHSQTKTLEDLQNEVELMKRQLGRLQAEQEAQQAEQEAQKETMAKWQAANEVFRALGEIGWSQISAERKYDLVNTKGINNFTELYYNYRASDTTTMATYLSVDYHIRRFGGWGDRGHVAHPKISMACLQGVLDKLSISGSLRDQLISDVYTEA
ncbi:uncharacterized protein BJ212DRAFT_1348383 [Suillus subaureus]|uniref:Uncharacterized protein n=1 Tax=Suillus subaureus TaxID=48587 RepID=A0A9P7ECK7_9AGAM|nr:uncharacterized protein BJ212DRAFT_1348383 [Suillus subaureus]KAG1818028.1 hypothetical protein BJ212DRAFT_1348383 [Suillus subaureus]